MFYTDKGDRFIMQFGGATFIELHKNDIFTLSDKDELKLITGDGLCTSSNKPVAPRIIGKKARVILLEHFEFKPVSTLQNQVLEYFELEPRKIDSSNSRWYPDARTSGRNAHNIKVTIANKQLRPSWNI